MMVCDRNAMSYTSCILCIPIGLAGDSMDRVLLRVLEMLCSVSLIMQMVLTTTTHTHSDTLEGSSMSS